eukprot:2859598-Amphidinium_carterae.1
MSSNMWLNLHMCLRAQLRGREQMERSCLDGVDCDSLAMCNAQLNPLPKFTTPGCKNACTC